MKIEVNQWEINRINRALWLYIKDKPDDSEYIDYDKVKELRWKIYEFVEHEDGYATSEDNL